MDAKRAFHGRRRSALGEFVPLRDYKYSSRGLARFHSRVVRSRYFQGGGALKWEVISAAGGGEREIHDLSRISCCCCTGLSAGAPVNEDYYSASRSDAKRFMLNELDSESFALLCI